MQCFQVQVVKLPFLPKNCFFRTENDIFFEKFILFKKSIIIYKMINLWSFDLKPVMNTFYSKFMSDQNYI